MSDHGSTCKVKTGSSERLGPTAFSWAASSAFGERSFGPADLDGAADRRGITRRHQGTGHRRGRIGPLHGNRRDPPAREIEGRKIGRVIACDGAGAVADAGSEIGQIRGGLRL